jgi:hypothetical protein
MNGNWLIGCHSSKELSFGTPKDAFQGRVHGDSLVGILRRNYNATPGCDLHVTFPSINEDAEIRDRRNRAKTNKNQSAMGRTVLDGTMCVKGTQLYTIDQLSARCDEATMYGECLKVGGWDEDKASDIPDALWRTMVADRGPCQEMVLTKLCD